jgi:DNA-binding HxlR family transcriptional regulator
VAGRNGTPRSGCPVNISLEVFGDRWSLLIVRDLMVRGFTTFQDFVDSGEGIATNILADRLKRLRRCGIVTGEKDEKDGRRVIYRLTEKGIDLAPVMLELLIWGAQHENTGVPPAVIAELARNRKAVLEEAVRRWRERDPAPLLPWLGGPRRQVAVVSVRRSNEGVSRRTAGGKAKS